MNGFSTYIQVCINRAIDKYDLKNKLILEITHQHYDYANFTIRANINTPNVTRDASMMYITNNDEIDAYTLSVVGLNWSALNDILGKLKIRRLSHNSSKETIRKVINIYVKFIAKRFDALFKIDEDLSECALDDENDIVKAFTENSSTASCLADFKQLLLEVEILLTM